MKPSSIFSARPSTFAVALIVFGIASIYAQVTFGAGSSIIGQPPGQASSIIGQPVPGQAGSALGHPAPGQGGMGSMQPNYPGTSSTGDRDMVRDKLDRANREAADIDRDGRISPEEASRLPGGTLPSGTSVPR